MIRLTPADNATAVLVYCEDGASRKELQNLQLNGMIRLVTFPYECKSSRNHPSLWASEARVHDLDRVKIKDLTYIVDGFSGSEHFSSILTIVGKQSYKDALHIDSAYKSGCRCFLSRDKSDIISKRTELECLLGFPFFNPNIDWAEFLDFVGGASVGSDLGSWF